MPERYAVSYRGKPDGYRPATWDTGQVYTGGYAPPTSGVMAVYSGGLSLPSYYGGGGAGYDFIRPGGNRGILSVQATGRLWDPFGTFQSSGQGLSIGVFSETSLETGQPSSGGHLAVTKDNWELAVFWEGTTNPGKWQSLSGARSWVAVANAEVTPKLEWDYKAGTVTVTPPDGGAPETFYHPIIQARTVEGYTPWTKGFVELVGTASGAGVIPQWFEAEAFVQDPILTALIVSVDEVKDWTGETVTQSHILLAQAAVGLAVGRDLEDASWRVRVPYTRDQRHLRKAVAYQAAWLPAHPDAFTAADITSSTVDGASQDYRDTGIVLAPLARMALRRLSWRGSRSITVSAGGERALVRDYTVSVGEQYDDGEAWKPYP